MSTIESFKCHECGGPMHAMLDAARYTYICSDESCSARSVIVERGDAEPLRYDMGSALFPTKGGQSPKEQTPVSVSNGGGGEASVSAAVAVLKLAGLTEEQLRIVEDAAKEIKR